MATFRARQNKKRQVRWQAQVRRKGHPPVTATLSTKTGAMAWAKRLEVAMETDRLLPGMEATKHTLNEAIDRYLSRGLTDLVPRARQSRKHHLEFWRGKLGAHTLANLTPVSIADTLDGLLERGVAPPTTNRYLASLSVVLELCCRELEWMETNPVRRVKRQKENPGRLRYLSLDEKDRLLAACQESKDSRLYPLVLFAMFTGARKGELLGLRWADVDALDLSAVLNKTKNRDRRTLHFPGPLGETLREMSRTPHISGYLFASIHGKPTFPRKAWHHAVEQAEIEDFTFHGLRHTAASYLAMNGANLADIAEVLGHRSLSMTKRYAHLSKSHTKAVTASMVAKNLA